MHASFHPGNAAARDAAINLGRLKTCWRESGSGIRGTVLMFHSLGLDRLAFDSLRAAVSEGWRLVSYDMPGHGSAANCTAFDWGQCIDAAQAALDACGDTSLHLVGHSMGGAVAASLAGRARGRIASLSLLATPAAGMPAFAERGQMALAQGMEAVVADTLRRWFGDTPALNDDAAVSYARAALLAMRAEGFAAAWQALASFSGYSALAEQLPPTLLIAADDDLSTPPQVMQRIVQAFSDAAVPQCVQMARVPRSGHMVPLTAPRAVAALLERHWHAHPSHKSTRNIPLPSTKTSLN
jgi:3-oxoadipate enol-lactonase